MSTSMTKPIDILIVDDSPAMQQLLSLIIGAESDLNINGVAASAEQGWQLFCRATPDVVVLDLELPGRPGMDLLRRIIREKPVPVIIVSANGGTGSAETIEALAAGAVAFIDKPDSITISPEQFRVLLIQTLRQSAQSTGALTRLAPRLSSPAAEPPRHGNVASAARVLAIGSSTGGVPAAQSVLKGLGGARLPIVLAQHMPAGYTRRLAERLSQTTGYDAREATDGAALEPGKIFVAPGDLHLIVERAGGGYRCRLDSGPEVSGHRPSVDVLFRSVAEACGPKGIGVILTGMGRDGAEGLLAMRKAGAMTVAEAEQTAIVFGMPKAAIQMGAAAETLPLPMIPGFLLNTLSPGPVQPARAPAPPPQGKDLRTKSISAFRVLVVDDQRSMRGLAAMSLKQLGFTLVEEAESGEAAIKRVGEEEFDLILLDWNMDGMSGLDALKTIRKQRGPRDLAVIMATSENSISKVHEATVAGASNYLVKPYDAINLKNRLERALMRSIPIAA
jgi:two-component system chemotaxis response regulator CheB